MRNLEILFTFHAKREGVILANRSYIYAHSPGDDPDYRDLGEWKSNVPLAHKILVGFDNDTTQSMLWTVDEEIAVTGDAEQGLAALEAFLNWLEPHITDDHFTDQKARALKLLRKEDRQGIHFHLEPGEVYELTGLELDAMHRETRRLADDASRIAEAALKLAKTDAHFIGSGYEHLASDWEETLGLYFPGVLFFHVG